MHSADIHTFVSCIRQAVRVCTAWPRSTTDTSLPEQKANKFATTEEEREGAALELSEFITRRQQQLLTIWYAIIDGHSLLKPTIGRRVARMHGTTKGRWEREARAF